MSNSSGIASLNVRGTVNRSQQNLAPRRLLMPSIGQAFSAEDVFHSFSITNV